ncbi:MAG: type II toxin-antitoxin system VapC family toxin [Myxococcales bacterium]|nr:type II toxin-antitoxin system VapC family toxin [Myxococcales bacterium]
MTFVIDASAAIEYLLRTPAGIHLDGLMRDAVLLAPELIDIEVFSALRRGTRRRLLSADRAEEALADMVSWRLERIPNRSLLGTAWSYRDNLTAYDAVYVALARLNAAAVLTVDGPLSRAPVREVVVQNVRAAAD